MPMSTIGAAAATMMTVSGALAPHRSRAPTAIIGLYRSIDDSPLRHADIAISIIDAVNYRRDAIYINEKYIASSKVFSYTKRAHAEREISA